VRKRTVFISFLPLVEVVTIDLHIWLTDKTGLT